MEIERKWILNRVPTEFKQIVHTQTESFIFQQALKCD